jgi:hypothetical protein
MRTIRQSVRYSFAATIVCAALVGCRERATAPDTELSLSNQDPVPAVVLAAIAGHYTLPGNVIIGYPKEGNQWSGEITISQPSRTNPSFGGSYSIQFSGPDLHPDAPPFTGTIDGTLKPDSTFTMLLSNTLPQPQLRWEWKGSVSGNSISGQWQLSNPHVPGSITAFSHFLGTKN